QMRPLALCIGTLLITQRALATMSISIHNITDKLKPEDEKYTKALSTAADAFKEAEALFNDDAFIARRGWKKEAETGAGDIVYGKSTPNGKMVTVSTILEGKVDDVMKETWTGVDSLPSWNANVDYASYVAELSDHAQIVTYGSNNVFVISGRDVVSARLYRPLPDGGYIMGARSVEVDSKPERDGFVRTHLHLGAMRYRANPENANQTRCDTVMMIDLKGMIPQFLVNQIAGKILVLEIEETVKHFKDLAEKSTSQ
ncbi:hypothetical protein PENTCL1PPCAC_25845, partial [Pristionchus entomophagus]